MKQPSLMHLVPCQHSLSALGGGGGGGGKLQMRVKIKTPKIPYGYHQNPRKILGSKINPIPPPPQNPLLNFLALKFPQVWLFLFAELYGWDTQELPRIFRLC